MTEHEALGDPDAPYEPTKRDVRRQRDAERIRDAARRMHFHQITGGESAGRHMSHAHEGDEAIGHLHAPERRYPGRADGGFIEELGPSLGRSGPPISKETLETVARLLAVKTPDDQLMRWRLRHFCGHVVESTAHISHTDPSRAFTAMRTCPECGLDPATVVAAKPLGPKETKNDPTSSDAERTKRRETATKRLQRAEAEVERLRAELKKLNDDSA